MTVKLTDEQWEKIGESIDTLENLTASLTLMTSVADATHVEALRSALPELVNELKNVQADVEA